MYKSMIFLVVVVGLGITLGEDPFLTEPVVGHIWGSVEVVETNDFDSYEMAICRTLRCKKGEECVLQGRIASCQCREMCPHNDRPICASDGVTYQSHCHLHRRACLSGMKLHLVGHGPCDDSKSDVVLPVSFINSSGNSTAPITRLHGNLVHPVSLESSTFRPTEEENGDQITATFPSTSEAPLSLITANDGEPRFCSSEDFLYVPSNLLLYFHAKYAGAGDGGTPDKGKSYLVHLMYDHLDLNADRILTKDEFHRLDEEGKYKKLLPAGCHILDLLTHADSDGDGRLNEREFFRLFDLPVAFISPYNEVKIHRVEVGQQYQLFCDIEKYNSASLKVTWYRYDVPLVNVAPYDFEVSADGSLYLTPASLTHNGNFTCRVPITLSGSPSVGGAPELSSNALQQVHVVNVFERPTLTVSPDFLLLKTGENGYLQCDVGGYPAPRINWDKNGRLYRENVSVLHLANVRSYDTGSYRCVIASLPGADNNASGGELVGDFVQRTASVVVRDRYDQPEMALRFNSRHHADSFFILYESGLRVFRADDCTLLHAIPSTYPTTEEKQGFLCHDHRCHWSDAVITQSSTYLYAALPQQMALIKINITSGGVEQVFHLNHMPMKLRYIEWEDSVWIECWHEADGNYRTVQVIRSASKVMRHTLTHALPLRDEFDAVHHVFLPTVGRLKYGYVTHVRERALHKIDLHSLKIVSRVSLVPYDCEPSHVVFIAQVGLAVVQCSPAFQTGNHSGSGGQLVLDYISDATLSYDADAHGTPVVTDDGRWIVNVDAVLGRIFVHKVDEKGGTLAATIDEFLPITDWTLRQSITYGSWDLFAAPLNDVHLIKIGVPDAKIERLTVFQDDKASKAIKLVAASRRSRYMVGATSDTVFSVDLFGPSSVKCQIKLNGTQKIVWAA